MEVNVQWIIVGFALATGLSIALIAWLVSRLAAEVPDQDRTWLDRPPLGFRILWWPTQWLAYYLETWIPENSRERQDGKLRVAALDYALNAPQFLAARLLWGGVWALIAIWLADSFDLPRLTPALLGFLLGYFYPAIWLRDNIELRRRETFKTLPFMLDIITLCIEGGLNLNGAIQQAVDKGPTGALRSEFSRLLRDIRAGRPRAEALRDLARRMDMPPITNFIATLIQSEASGMSLGPILRAQAEQRRIERFARAEKQAMEAPVKMLFPLLVFIFPCVFVILLFPIVIKFMAAGGM
jgi:tight adherence protein C